MKIKIKVKVHNEDCFPQVIGKGDWIDLKSTMFCNLKSPKITLTGEAKEGKAGEVSFDTRLISLGVSIKLPKGFEAVVVPRSSTFKTYGILQTNSFGVIDNSYCGDTDEWKFPVIATKRTTINVGDRICQFRIQLSQKASLWNKLLWLLSSGIELERVEKLDSLSRGGFGSTGKN